MRIGIIGYGRMGKIIEQIALSRGHTISCIKDLPSDALSPDTDCFIDFSLASAMNENVTLITDMKVPVVIGTTGWLEKLPEYEALFIQKQVKGVWGGNFSLGVNLFWKVIAEASKTFAGATDYDVMVHEYHHKNKADSPSGTALETAKYILKNYQRKTSIVTEKLDRRPEPNELHVSSTRGGSIPGIHTVLFDSDFDTIELTHTARGREGFALGAVIAAENIAKFPKGLSNFSENISCIF